MNFDNITIIKRNGKEEPFSHRKLKRVCLWACDDNEIMADQLIEDMILKSSPKLKIQTLVHNLIHTAASKISMIQPQWEFVAAKLLLLDVYKTSWNISDFRYPHLKDVIQKGERLGLYSKEFCLSWDETDLEQLNEFIVPERDFLFVYRGLHIILQKYCKRVSKNVLLEFPQHLYMRIAMFLMMNERHDRIEKVKNLYDILSQHQVTFGTPIMLNAAKEKGQMSSCVLMAIGDDTDSIMDGIHDAATYSKYSGGIATDWSLVRASNSPISGNGGKSSGPVPFIKILESTMLGFNQGGVRKGISVVTFPFWHKDALDLINLKSNSGTEENRARHLQYSIKLNKILFDRVDSDDFITLFDPIDVPDLNFSYGEEFDRLYREYEKTKKGVRVKAKDFMFQILKNRLEHGNLYVFFDDNVNEKNMLNRYVNSSNLCQEITEPSRPGMMIENSYYQTETGEIVETKKFIPPEISLCNLASVNLYEWEKSGFDFKIIETLVRALDNTIDLSYYPVKGAKISNLKYRYLGIGVTNYAKLLASKGLKFESEETLEYVDELFHRLASDVIKASSFLAKEKGVFPAFEETKWFEGKLPWDQLKDGDEELISLIQENGMRNALTMAIAPTATSGKAINATESIEPPSSFFFRDEGTIVLPCVVPNFKEFKYEKAFDIDPEWMLRHASVRQKYIDQSQSVNMYISGEYLTSARKLYELHKKAFELGLKTLYYCKTLKMGIDDVCEACT